VNDYLALAVPLRMAELRAAGGPTDTDWDSLPDAAHELSAHGDVLLYGGRPGEAARLASGLANAIAVLAFAPGGVTVAGQHFEAQEAR
jgi:hypothetical protein